MTFVLFDRDETPTGRAAAVTLQKRGTMTFNFNAYKMMGEPQAVQLLYNPEQRIIGVRPCAKDEPSSFELRQQSRKDQAPMAIPTTSFVQHFGIDTSVSRRYSPTWENGMLLVDLSKGGTEVIRVRIPKTSEESTTPASDDDSVDD